MKIIINEVPLSKNKYISIHWAKRREYKNWVRWQIFDADKREGNKKKPFNKAIITFNIFFRTNRKRDVANFLGGGLIAWLDVLVDLHFIKDDNYEIIGQPLVNFYYDKNDPRTEIIIKELKGGKSIV